MLPLHGLLPTIFVVVVVVVVVVVCLFCFYFAEQFVPYTITIFE